MKVLHVIPSLSVSSAGGPAQAVMQLCEELKHQGVEVAIVTTITDNCWTSGSVPVYYFPRRFNAFLPPQLAFSLPLKNWLKQRIKEFDLLHIHFLFSYPCTVACYYANKHGIPYILRPAGMLDDFCLKKSAIKKKFYILFFEKRNLKKAAAINFTSEEEMHSADKFKLNAQRILLPIGLALDKFRNIESLKGVFRKRYPQAADRKIVLFFSRVDPKKGLDVLIPALKILSGKRNDFVFVICGAGHKNYVRWIRRALEAAGLTGLSIFTGYLEGEMKLAVLADSDVFVLSSYDENFGIAVAEAMAAGLPVVVSNRVKIHNLIEDYRAGVVTELNSREIALQLDKILEDKELRIKMGINGKRLAEDNLDLRKIAKKMVDIYLGLALKKV